MILNLQVVESYELAYPSPIKISIGETVQIEKWEPEGSEWAGWVFCVDQRGIKGWVSEKCLHVNGNSAIAIRDYDATELGVQKGEMVRVHQKESGWAWVENSHGSQGWIPLKNLVLAKTFSSEHRGLLFLTK